MEILDELGKPRKEYLLAFTEHENSVKLYAQAYHTFSSAFLIENQGGGY